MNCEAYSYFEGVFTDHRIVTEKIPLRVCRNAVQTTKSAHYDWSLLNNRGISDKYTITLRNKIDALQEISEALTSNDEYEKLVNTHMKAAAKCIQTKLRAKHKFPWEVLAVKKNVTTWKPHPHVIRGTQLMPTLRNLRGHKAN